MLGSTLLPLARMDRLRSRISPRKLFWASKNFYQQVFVRLVNVSQSRRNQDKRSVRLGDSYRVAARCFQLHNLRAL